MTRLMQSRKDTKVKPAAIYTFPQMFHTFGTQVRRHTHLLFAVIVGLLQLPIDESSLRLGAALQEHAAVLHTKHNPVLHAAP